MRLLIECHHPAHIHFFKHAVKAWQDNGHRVLMIARDRDVIKDLLEAYGWIPHEIPTSAKRRNRFPLGEMVKRQWSMFRKIRSFKPDAVLSLMGSYSQSSVLFGIPNIIFTDSEFQHFNHRIAHPFATYIYTPECFYKDLGSKQRRYKGYHELAFLHPNYFKPAEDVLELMGARPKEYVILRVSGWNTFHDIGQRGLGETFGRFIRELTGRITTFIVPEGGVLSPEYERYKLNIPPERFHDAVAFARLVVTEGASTASEAACLGVPAVFINTTDRGYLNDQERRYGLVSNFREPNSALEQIIRFLDTFTDTTKYSEARDKLISDHIDVTQFLVEEIGRICKA